MFIATEDPIKVHKVLFLGTGGLCKAGAMAVLGGILVEGPEQWLRN